MAAAVTLSVSLREVFLFSFAAVASASASSRAAAAADSLVTERGVLGFAIVLFTL